MTICMLFASTYNNFNFTNSKLPTLNISTATILKSDPFFLQYCAHVHPNVTETQT